MKLSNDRHRIGMDLRSNTATNVTKSIWILASNKGDDVISKFYHENLHGKSDRERRHVSIKPLEKDLKKKCQIILGWETKHSSWRRRRKGYHECDAATVVEIDSLGFPVFLLDRARLFRRRTFCVVELLNVTIVQKVSEPCIVKWCCRDRQHVLRVCSGIEKG